MQLTYLKEFIYALLLLSGTVKMLQPLIDLSSIPDLTLLTATVTTLFILYYLPKTLSRLSIKKVQGVVLITLFYLFIVLSLTYTSSASYSITKTVNFGTMALAFYFPLLVRGFNMRRFMRAYTSISFFINIVFFSFFIVYISDINSASLSWMTAEEKNHLTALYLTVSLINGILILYYFFSNNEKKWIRIIIVLIAFISLILAGGRGPLLFVVLIFLFYTLSQLFLIFTTFRFAKLFIPVLFFISIISYGMVIVSSMDRTEDSKILNMMDNSITRLEVLLTSDDGGSSAYSRILFTKFALEKINEKPFFGYGIGSFGYELYNNDEREYPHNVFLEVWFELGIIPLIIFITIFYLVYKNIKVYYVTWGMAIYIYFILNILKSSSLVDIRMMLGFFAIFLTFNKVNIKERN